MNYCLVTLFPSVLSLSLTLFLSVSLLSLALFFSVSLLSLALLPIFFLSTFLSLCFSPQHAALQSLEFPVSSPLSLSLFLSLSLSVSPSWYLSLHPSPL